jgi:predicted alpha/beta superfamily hydrolase
MRPIAALAGLLALSTTASAQFPQVAIPNTELRSIHSKSTGRDYDLYIYPPTTSSPGQKHPVLYLLDGQWDFKLLASIQGGLLYDKFTPDVIIVGITYSGAHANYDSLRAVDYTPRPGPNNPGSGDGPRFLSFLRTELLPWVESNYPADPKQRALMGASLGGLFTLYAMFTEPSLFSGYAAGSPAVTYASRGAFADEAAFAKTHSSLPVKLYIAVGDAEPLADPVREMIAKIRSRNYEGLKLETRMIAGERHSGNKPEAFNRGLRFLFGSQ